LDADHPRNGVLIARRSTRAVFLAAATAHGFFEPDVSPGFLLEPTVETCAHGLPYNCCPCGCGDL
jgi:hypothetical protein